jgi:hypothetical protein
LVFFISPRLSKFSRGSDSSEEGDPAPRDVVVTPEPEIKGEIVDNNQRMKGKSACVSVIPINSTTAGIFHANFYDELDHKKTLRQVIVDDFPVQLSTPANGGKKYSALLLQLIPAAIQNDSPIKGSCDSNPILCLIDEISLERSRRFYRPNIRDDPQHHHLGKIDALLDGSASALKVNAMNEYTLGTSDDATSECDIFWDQLTGSAITGQSDGHEVSTASSF